MPMLDMPLEALKQYRGTNPCPLDFDAYWDRALKESNESVPAAELLPADVQFPNTECFELYFNGSDGARIHAKYLRPKNHEEKLPVIFQFHGYGGWSGDWMDKLSFVSLGFALVAIDCRGQSGQSIDLGGVSGSTIYGHIVRGLQDGPEHLLYRQIFLDTVRLVGVVLDFDEIDENRAVVIGGSQGGGLSLACASLEPRIRKAVVIHPYLCDYKRVWEMDLAKDAYVALRDYFRVYDPRHEHEDELFTTLGYIDVQHLVKRMKAAVFFGCTQMDPICPPSTQFAAYNKIPSPKKMLLYPDFSHEGLPGFWDIAAQFLTKDTVEF